MLSGRLRAAVVLAGARNADANAHILSVRRRTIGIRIAADKTRIFAARARSWALKAHVSGAPFLLVPAPVEKSFNTLMFSRNSAAQQPPVLFNLLCCSLACDRAMIALSHRHSLAPW